MQSYEASFRNAIAEGQYETVINYLNNHGTDEYGAMIFEYATACNATPIVRELAMIGFDFLSVEGAAIPDEMADTIFGEPDDAVDALTENSSESMKRFIVARQMAYSLSPSTLIIGAKPFLKPYYLLEMV
jgi:hypothetical protein